MSGPTARNVLRALGLALILLAPAQAGAQRVQVQGRGDAVLDDLVRRFLRDTATLVLTRDTLIARGDTLHGPVAAIGISLRVEGAIDGALLIVDANVFIRPFGTVRGTVTNVAGGFFPSEFATVEAEVTDRGDAPYDVERRSDGGVRIVGLARRQVLDPDGLRGIRWPTYDRVAGVTLGIGATWYPIRAGRVEPRLRAWGGWAFEREDWVGGAAFALIGLRTDFEFGAERVTATPDAWNRGDLLNTLGVALNGSDYRNWYAAERAHAELRRLAGPWTFRLGALLEDAESLPAARVWAIDRPDSARPNPAVDDGRIVSATAGVGLDRDGERFRARGDVSAELGRDVLDGQFDFGRYTLDGAFAARTIGRQTLEVRARVQGPLPGTDSLPRQRWGILGGLETIETFSPGELRGDRLALLRTTWGVPLDPFRVPFLGSPVIEALHSAAAAWVMDGDADVRHAVGLRIHFPLINAFAFVDPTGDRKPAFGVAVRLRRSFPWEQSY